MSEILFRAKVVNSPWEDLPKSFEFVIKNKSKDFVIINDSKHEEKCEITNEMSIYWYFYYHLDSLSIPSDVWKWLKNNTYYELIIDHVHADIDWLTDLYDSEDKTEFIKELKLSRTKVSSKLFISIMEKEDLEKCSLEFRKYINNYFLDYNFLL